MILILFSRTSETDALRCCVRMTIDIVQNKEKGRKGHSDAYGAGNAESIDTKRLCLTSKRDQSIFVTYLGYRYVHHHSDFQRSKDSALDIYSRSELSSLADKQ